MTTPAPPLLYFAYGSNMLTRRLARRVPEVRVVGPAWLPGYRMAFNKSGLDGSAKAAVAPGQDAFGSAPAEGVHGVLFELPSAARARLDRIEGGYRPETVGVRLEGFGVPAAAGREVAALTYLADPAHLDDTLRPFCWYRDFVVHGAREHRLPEPWVRELEAVGVLEDPDPRRLRENRAILEAMAAGGACGEP